MVSKRGKYGGTWSHPLIALRFAAWLDPELEVEIYHQFLESKILEKRVKSSDAWNKIRDSYTNMVGRETFKFYDFIHIANAISSKLSCNDWNSATEETLSKRTQIQDMLSALMDTKIIKTKEQLLKTINKIEV